MGFSRRVVLLVVAALALAGGGIAAGILITEDGSSGGGSTLEARYTYPQSAKTQLLSACTTHSKKSLCDCIVSAYEATMPYGIYKDIARGGVRTENKAYFQAFTHASSRCS